MKMKNPVKKIISILEKSGFYVAHIREYSRASFDLIARRDDLLVVVRAVGNIDSISKENVVALCDVDENHLDYASEKFPKAKRYVDWRKCLEQKDLDAVVCCTTDHTHAFIANWA